MHVMAEVCVSRVIRHEAENSTGPMGLVLASLQFAFCSSYLSLLLFLLGHGVLQLCEGP